MSELPLILVSNDDGVSAAGIRHLAQAMEGLGRVVVVAPEHEQSATSHSLTLKRPLRIISMGEHIYAVDGTPTDAVTLAIRWILKEDRPALVVSGINHGANLGDDIHYSGTVAAALEGTLLGVPSIAFSLVGRDHFQFDTAVAYARALVKTTLNEGLPAGTMLNVNIPNVPLSEIKGLRFTVQGKRNYGDIIFENRDPRGKLYYWIGGNEFSFEDIIESDCNAIRDGYVSVTPIKTGLTDVALLQSMKDWKLDV